MSYLTPPERPCDICSELDCECTEQEIEERSERDYQRGREFAEKIHKEIKQNKLID